MIRPTANQIDKRPGNAASCRRKSDPFGTMDGRERTTAATGTADSDEKLQQDRLVSMPEPILEIEVGGSRGPTGDGFFLI